MQRIASEGDPAGHRELRRRAWLGGAAALWLGDRSLAASPPDPLAGQGMPYAAFDRLPADIIEVAGGRIRVAFGPGRFVLPRSQLLAHVSRSAHAVAVYFGRFPAADTRLLLLCTETAGRRVRAGTAFGHRGAAIKLVLSANVSAADLAQDWILVHEMCHLALPSLPQAQHWLEEGMATYVEPLARAQVGDLTAQQVWTGMLRGLPDGLPQPSDRGLDHTPTWGRTYWGGALFCLLADVELRKRTAGRKGLQQALQAMLGVGNMELDSALPPLLRAADEAVGVPVLSELYARMRAQPYPVDLPALWRKLGVRLDDRQGVVFDDAAPGAAIRRALTAPLGG